MFYDLKHVIYIFNIVYFIGKKVFKMNGSNASYVMSERYR